MILGDGMVNKIKNEVLEILIKNFPKYDWSVLFGGELFSIVCILDDGQNSISKCDFFLERYDGCL